MTNDPAPSPAPDFGYDIPILVCSGLEFDGVGGGARVRIRELRVTRIAIEFLWEILLEPAEPRSIQTRRDLVMEISSPDGACRIEAGSLVHVDGLLAHGTGTVLADSAAVWCCVAPIPDHGAVELVASWPSQGIDRVSAPLGSDILQSASARVVAIADAPLREPI